MIRQWYDIGVNLFSEQFAKDRPAVIQRARAQGVSQLLLISSDLAETRLNISWCAEHQGCVTTAGVHPHQAARVQPGWQEELRRLLQHSSSVAVGECGLDFNRNFSPRPQQISVFTEQLQLSRLFAKPVYLHERDAFGTQLAILKEHQISLGVVHCFTGDTTQLKAYLDLGLYIGITGWVCDERRGQALQQAIPYIPDDRLLLETDAPYLLPRNISPKPADRRNEPALLPAIAGTVATLRQTSLEQLSAITFANSQRLFRHPTQPADPHA
ncbi:TatD family hydrolase [Chromatiaceae bacterium AAb-1]|nr:TatD family hydrolase [Chromatiaceae bacterium AAb-1]